MLQLDKSISFLALSGEIRNQIYLDILGPQLCRPDDDTPFYEQEKGYFDPKAKGFFIDHQFNRSILLVNRQVNREFSDVLWQHLRVDLLIETLRLDQKDMARLLSMPRLEQCTLRIHLTHRWQHPDVHGDDFDQRIVDIDLTVFSIAHKLSRMSRLNRVCVDYIEDQDDYDDDHFLRYRDGSIIRRSYSDLKDFLGQDLRGIKNLQVTGTLCGECTALLVSAMECPPEVYIQDPDYCFPTETTPEWSDKVRNWI